MWLFFIVVPLIIILVVGGLLAGGIFTIVFLPIAAIILGSAVLYTMWGRSTAPENIPGERERVAPLPHTDHANAAPAPTRPEQLVDARRREQ